MTRAVVLAFLRQVLLGDTGDVFYDLPAPTDLYVYGIRCPASERLPRPAGD